MRNITKRTAQEIIADMPPMGWGTLNTDRCLVIGMKPGSVGYWPIRQCRTPEEAEAFAADMNEHCGVSAAQRKAFEHGSCFGWDLPIADPLNWQEDGTPA